MAYPTYMFPYGQFRGPVPVVYLAKTHKQLKEIMAAIRTEGAMYTLWMGNPAGLRCDRIVIFASRIAETVERVTDIETCWRIRLNAGCENELYWVG